MIIRDAYGRHERTGEAVRLSRIPTAGDLFVRKISTPGRSFGLEAYRVFKENQAAIVVEEAAISEDLLEALALG